MSEVINIFWILSVAAELTLALSLLIRGLGGLYSALLAASCVFAVKSALLMASMWESSALMRDVWKMTEPLEWAMSFWIILELFSRWTASYPGIGRFGKWLLGATMVLAILLSVAIWSVEWQALLFAHDFRVFYMLRRFVLATLALFGFGTWFFFRNYRAPIAPNVVRHTRISVIYFAITAAGALMFNFKGAKVGASINLLMVVATMLCFLSWAWFLTSAGEIAGPDEQVSDSDKDRIDKLNRELLSFMKNFSAF